MTTLGRAASLGDTLRHIRESKDMTLRAAATATGISNAYISQIETGRIITPSPGFLRKLAHGYGVSYDELMRVAGYTDATSDATPIAPLPTLGRAASLRVAYASAMQDVQRLTAERDALKTDVSVKLKGGQWATDKIGEFARALDVVEKERDAATARADAAEAEVKRLRDIGKKMWWWLGNVCEEESEYNDLWLAWGSTFGDEVRAVFGEWRQEG